MEWFFEDSDTWLRIENAGQVLFRLELGRNTSAFRDVRVWGELVAVGWGDRVLFVNPVRGSVVTFELGDYFGHFYHDEECMLACSASRVFRFDPSGVLAWTGPSVGLDGVIVHSVAEGTIIGEGEWDPPGGWRPFQLDFDSGQEL